MEKLKNTLKAGLFNGLIVRYDNKDLELDGMDLLGLRLRGMYKYTIPEQNTFPHLFDLSDLVTPIRVEGYNDGKEFVPTMELFILFGGGYRTFEAFSQDWLDNLFYTPVEQLSFGIVQILIQWHFNIFKLSPDQFINARESKVYEPKTK